MFLCVLTFGNLFLTLFLVNFQIFLSAEIFATFIFIITIALQNLKMVAFGYCWKNWFVMKVVKEITIKSIEGMFINM